MIEGVFPVEIYVAQFVEDEDDVSLNAAEDVEGLGGIESDQPVAVYKLVHVGKAITTRRFVAPPPKKGRADGGGDG